jgi:hypothetical protein
MCIYSIAFVGAYRFTVYAFLKLIYRHALWRLPGLGVRPVARSESTQGNTNSERKQTHIHVSRGLESNVLVSEM